MASGSVLCKFKPYSSEETGSSTGWKRRRNGRPVLELEPTGTQIQGSWSDAMSGWSGSGNIAADIHASMNGNTGGDVVGFTGAFERIGNEFHDVDGGGYAAAQSVSGAVPATNGHVKIYTITFTPSQVDGLLNGEFFRFRLVRDTGVAGNANYNAQVYIVVLREV